MTARVTGSRLIAAPPRISAPRRHRRLATRLGRQGQGDEQARHPPAQPGPRPACPPPAKGGGEGGSGRGCARLQRGAAPGRSPPRLSNAALTPPPPRASSRRGPASPGRRARSAWCVSICSITAGPVSSAAGRQMVAPVDRRLRPAAEPDPPRPGLRLGQGRLAAPQARSAADRSISGRGPITEQLRLTRFARIVGSATRKRA